MRKYHLHMNQLEGKLLLVTALLCLWYCPAVSADELAVGRFASQGLADWEPKSFSGFTEYRLMPENGTVVLQASSHASASGLIKKISFDPRKYRYLSWHWKIEQTIPGGEETTKTGDDYAARIYVVFPGNYFWQTKAINYIWANHLKRGSSIANAYTGNAVMVAVQSGNTHAGQWHYEERDIFSDYLKLFGSEPGLASAVAIMSDTDNTGSKTLAWYGDITLSSDPRKNVPASSNPAPAQSDIE